MPVKKYENNLKEAVYALYDEETGTYGSVKSMKADGMGMVACSLAPAGDSQEYYADGEVWDSEENNNGYDGTIDMTHLSKTFLKDVLGYTEDTNGAIFENKNDVKKTFAFGFIVDGNKSRKTWYYNCKATRPNDEHGTNETSKTYATNSLTIQARPRTTDGQVKVRAEVGDDCYDEFFNSVYEKATLSI